MRYRAVLFDVDDTLLDFQTGNRNAVNQLMDELGYHDPDRYDQYEAINLKCWRELLRPLPGARGSELGGGAVRDLAGAAEHIAAQCP